MGSTRFKKRNINRYKKIYPFVQRTPRFVLQSEKEAIIEVANVVFSNEDTKIYEFVESYSSVPIITVAPSDNNGGDAYDASVSVMAVLVSTTKVTLAASQKFTGSVQVHVIWIEGT